MQNLSATPYASVGHDTLDRGVGQDRHQLSPLLHSVGLTMLARVDVKDIWRMRGSIPQLVLLEVANQAAERIDALPILVAVGEARPAIAAVLPGTAALTSLG